MMSTGNPRSVSKRVNASNGDDVSTPPKSQITASIIRFPAVLSSVVKTANTTVRRGPASRGGLASPAQQAISAAMKTLFPMLATALMVSSPASAIVGGAAPPVEVISRSVVTIVGSRGNFCSGALIAPNLVLTVAHCVRPGAEYRIVDYGAEGRPLPQPQLQDVKSIALHPGFAMQAF